MTDFVDVAALDTLPPGAQQTVMVGDTRVLLCHEQTSGQVWAVQDRCPHAFQPLVGGVVRGGTIQCPKHGACFNLATGRPINSVTPRPVQIYAARVQDGRILVSSTPVSPTALQGLP